jgi:hypothetical protein
MEKKLTLQNIFDRLRSGDLDLVEQQVINIREAFNCPSSVATMDEAESVFVRFYSSYAKMKYGDPAGVYTSPALALPDLERLVGGWGQLWDLRREAVYGPRNVMEIVDFLAEKMARSDLESHVDRVFDEARVTAGNIYALAEEMVARFGHLLSLPPYFHYSTLAADRRTFQKHVLQLALQLREVHNKWC